MLDLDLNFINVAQPDCIDSIFQAIIFNGGLCPDKDYPYTRRDIYHLLDIFPVDKMCMNELHTIIDYINI